MIILEMMTPAGEEFDFVIALKSERDDENVQYALDNGGCLLVEDSRAIQIWVEGCELSAERIALGVVLKRMIAYDSLEDEQMSEDDIPCFDNLLTDFAMELLRPSFGGENIEISEDDKLSFLSLFNNAIVGLVRKGLVIHMWDEFPGESHVEEDSLYGLSDDLLLKIARGDIKIS